LASFRFGRSSPSPQSQTRSASDALLPSIGLAVAAEDLGADGAYFRVHHFALHVQQTAQIRVIRAAWKGAGRAWEPRVSDNRSIFAFVDNRDRANFGGGGKEADQGGYIDEQTRAIFGRGCAAEPDVLVKQLTQDEAIAEADTLLPTVPNQLTGGPRARWL